LKKSTLIILAIIAGLLTIGLSWISGSERFALELPWIITIAPSIIFMVIFIIPFATKQDNENN